MALKKRTIIFGFVLIAALTFSAVYALSWGFTVHYISNLHMAVFGIFAGIVISFFGKINSRSEGAASAFISSILCFGLFILISALPFILPSVFPHGFDIGWPDGNLFYFVFTSFAVSLVNTPFVIIGAIIGSYLHKRRTSSNPDQIAK